MTFVTSLEFYDDSHKTRPLLEGDSLKSVNHKMQPLLEGDSVKSVNVQVVKNDFLKVMFSALFPWNPLLRCPRSQECSSTQFILKTEGCRLFQNFNDQISGILSVWYLNNQPHRWIPTVWYLKNQIDRWNCIGLISDKLVNRLDLMDRLGRVPRSTELLEPHIGEK